MIRRSFLQSIAGAVMASAMEVCGWRSDSDIDPRDYSFAAQLRIMKRNLAQNVMDIWEERSASMYHRVDGLTIDHF